MPSTDLDIKSASAAGHLKEHVYAVSPRTMLDLVARLQAAVTAVDVNMSR
jgi:hypothetical protein